MIRHKIAAILAALLAAGSLSALTACTPTDPEVETTAGAGGTQAIAEAETQAPRFDYFEEDLSAYVTLAPSAYATTTFEVPGDLQTTDEDIEVYVRYLRYTERVAVNGTQQVTDHPLDWGDDAYIYYRILVDGKEVAAASRMEADEPTKLGLGSTQLTPLEEKLVGIVPSETSREHPAVLEFTFPSSYGRDTLAGRDAVAEVYVVYAVQNTLPEMTWKFINETLGYEPRKDFYASDDAKVKEFYEWVSDYLMVQNQSTVKTVKQNLVWDALLEAAEFSALPESEVTYYYDMFLANMKDSHESRKTQYPTLDEFAPVYMGLEVGADWQTALRQKVERQVKIEMLAFVIARAEGLDKISDEELQREIDLWIEMNSSNVPVTDAEVRENVGLPTLYKQAISYKVQTFLMERMSFVYGEE